MFSGSRSSLIRGWRRSYRSLACQDSTVGKCSQDAVGAEIWDNFFGFKSIHADEWPMHQKMPPLNPLRTFEVAARCESFTDAAVELSVTQAAVSRQINVLEEFFNIKLFDRGPRALTLTTEGQRLYEEIGPAFEIIGWAAYEILRKRDGNIVTIQTYPTLTAMRLTPRLNDFTERNNEVALNFQSMYMRQRMIHENADIYILDATELPPNMDGFMLGRIVASPAVSPTLLKNCGDDPVRLLQEQPLLISKHCQTDWNDWATRAKVEIHNSRVMTFDRSFDAYNAARDGFGVCVAEHFLIADDIESGRLIFPFEESLDQNMFYWCAWSTNRHVTPQMRKTLDWIKSLIVPE